MRAVVTIMIFLFLLHDTIYAETSTTADSNQGKKIQLYANTGFSKPNNPNTFIDFWNIGYNIGGGVGYVIHDGYAI